MLIDAPSAAALLGAQLGARISIDEVQAAARPVSPFLAEPVLRGGDLGAAGRRRLAKLAGEDLQVASLWSGQARHVTPPPRTLLGTLDVAASSEAEGDGGQAPGHEPEEVSATWALSADAWRHFIVGTRRAASRRLRVSLGARRRALDEQDPALAEALQELGEVYMEQGRYSEASDLLAEAREIWRTLARSTPARASVQEAGVLADIGLLRLRQGRYEEADRADVEATKLCRPRRRQGQVRTLLVPVSHFTRTWLGLLRVTRTLSRALERVIPRTRSIAGWTFVADRCERRHPYSFRHAFDVGPIVERMRDERPHILYLYGRDAETFLDPMSLAQALTDGSYWPRPDCLILDGHRYGDLSDKDWETSFNAGALTFVARVVIALPDTIPEIVARSFVTDLYQLLAKGAAAGSGIGHAFRAAMELPLWARLLAATPPLLLTRPGEDPDWVRLPVPGP